MVGGLLLKASRPRFWSYLAGPFLLGWTAGGGGLEGLSAPLFWALLAYFLWPANLLLYAVNDLHDGDTDALNPRKGREELRASAAGAGRLSVAALAAVLLSVAALALLPNVESETGMLLLLALCWAYSAPPLRLKARPLLDSASNILYALPGVIAYAATTGEWPPGWVLGFAWMWTAGMHLYSAIPDIESDRAAGLNTSATLLGRRGGLVACSALWLGAWGALCFGVGWMPWGMAMLVYPAITLALLAAPAGEVERTYRWFPVLNGAAGMGAFFLMVQS